MPLEIDPKNRCLTTQRTGNQTYLPNIWWFLFWKCLGVMTPLLSWISATCQLSNKNDTTICKKFKLKKQKQLLWSVLAYFPFPKDQGSQQEQEASKIRQLFHMNSPPTFLWKLPPKGPKFNDVCVLFKHSNFYSRLLQNFMPPDPLITFCTCKSHLWHKLFPSPPTPKLLPPTKPYWKSWKTHRIMFELTHYLREYIIDISP